MRWKVQDQEKYHAGNGVIVKRENYRDNTNCRDKLEHDLRQRRMERSKGYKWLIKLKKKNVQDIFSCTFRISLYKLVLKY